MVSLTCLPWGITVIGGRPFSWGGSDWKHADFYRQYYGVNNFEESVARMQQAIDTAAYNHLIFMGHCGPTGLGSDPEAPVAETGTPLAATLAILIWPRLSPTPGPRVKPYLWSPLATCTTGCVIVKTDSGSGFAQIRKVRYI